MVIRNNNNNKIIIKINLYFLDDGNGILYIPYRREC